ncbi:hypothetical protein E2C01_091974 [Portunus trituberculatus]|uniref:Uncharacterized protein n=1 Tax=Portunus trituberculatus TaxID=210409 RepID=A0A5B7JPE5_PORTR|nr:hypothetical protein [Portunus trituberculatus]
MTFNIINTYMENNNNEQRFINTLSTDKRSTTNGITLGCAHPARSPVRVTNNKCLCQGRHTTRRYLD